MGKSMKMMDKTKIVMNKMVNTVMNKMMKTSRNKHMYMQLI